MSIIPPPSSNEAALASWPTPGCSPAVTMAGLGTALPLGSLTQNQLAQDAADCCAKSERHARVLTELYRRTTIQRRYSVLLPEPTDHSASMRAAFAPAKDPGALATDRGPTTDQRMRWYQQHAPALAEQAANAALLDAGIAPHQVEQLVVVTCTGFGSPGVDLRLIDRLGLPSDVGRTQLGFMGCHGALSGLRVAGPLAAQCRPDGAVLMVCIELCTLHFQYGWNKQAIVANSLFGDGSAAVVLTPSQPSPTKRQKDLLNSEDATLPDLPRLTAQASRVLPDTEDCMSWTITDHGFAMTLSPRTPEVIGHRLRPWVEDLLEPHALELSEIAGFAIHPGGPRVIEQVVEALGLPEHAGGASRHILQQYGNLSSPTVLFIADQLRREKTRRPWLMLAFGPGLTAEMALWT